MIGQVEGQTFHSRRFQGMRVIGKQHQGSQARRADGITFGNRLGGIAYGIQGIGDVADLLVQFGHFSNTTGIVGDRSIGIQGHDDPGHGQHGGRRDGNTVQPTQFISAPDGRTDGDYRCRSGFHGNPQASNDVGAVTSGGCFGNMANRGKFRRRIIFGNDDHQSGKHQADKCCQIQVHGRNLQATYSSAIREHHGGNRIERDGRDGASHAQTTVQGIHDLTAVARLDKEGSNNGSNDGNATKNQRIKNRVVTRTGDHEPSQEHGRHHGNGVGLEQVCRHTGAVAHVVTHVVGDNGRVARVILRNTGFHLAHDICAHISTFGEDAATQTGEDGNQRATKGKPHQRMNRITHTHHKEDAVETCHPQQSQAHYQHAGDSATAEGNLHGGIQAVIGGFSGTYVGAHGDIHADITCQTGKYGADGKAGRRGPAQKDADKNEQHHAHSTNGGVLAVEVGGSPRLHSSCNLVHSFVTSGLGQYPFHGHYAVTNGYQCADQRKYQAGRHSIPLLIFKLVDKRPATRQDCENALREVDRDANELVPLKGNQNH